VFEYLSIFVSCVKGYERVAGSWCWCLVTRVGVRNLVLELWWRRGIRVGIRVRRKRAGKRGKVGLGMQVKRLDFDRCCWI